LLVVIMAYVGARVVYNLGTEVTRARELGSYRLEHRLGEGGMGEVWKASHEMLARRAAIKLVRPNASAFTKHPTIWVERFRREANVIASLQSPHTIYLYDFGVSRDGRFYYVMELLEGISLQALVTDFGPLPPGRAVHVLSEMCESLHEAHERGLVHRDLKPSNIMLCEVALTYDFVKVLDFGLAKTLGDSGNMAPEIALAEESIDRRADIYAVGCVAYFLLTGTTVFEEENPTRMALKHVQDVPDAPSLRSGAAIPAALESLVMQCLEKQPADRPASMAEVAERLAQSGVEPWTTADAAAWWQAHQAPGTKHQTSRERS
jgi:serine/threonine-protein kinase